MKDTEGKHANHCPILSYLWYNISKSVDMCGEAIQVHNPLFVHLHVFVMCFNVMEADNLGYFNIIDTMMKSQVWINQIFAIYQVGLFMKKMYGKNIVFYHSIYYAIHDHWNIDSVTLRKKIYYMPDVGFELGKWGLRDQHANHYTNLASLLN